MADFRMPALGADMETGTLVRWLVAPGSRVHPGDVVAVVETHKGAIDCEIFLDGVIEDLAPEGTELPVGGVLAHVRVEGELSEAIPVPVRPAVASTPPVRAPAAHATSAGAPQAGPRQRASPAARRRARELGLALATVRPAAPGGALHVRDVELAARPEGGPQRTGERAGPSVRTGFDPAAMREGIAVAMAKSKREIPHYYLARDIDFAAAERWLDSCNAALPVEDRLLGAVLLLKASALALARHAQFNGFWREGAFRAAPAVHVGWAIAMRGGGLVAPAIHDADRKPVAQLMHDLRDLVQRVRQGGLRSSEMTDATVTVTSLGDRGADRVLGVIYPPQVALIGFGAARARPCVADGQVTAHPMVEASLAADHRASDGHAGSLLLAAIDDHLQHPERL